jgi:RHS repeat-associated protein
MIDNSVATPIFGDAQVAGISRNRLLELLRRSDFSGQRKNPELLQLNAADCACSRPLTKIQEEETITINPQADPTYPEEKSVLTSGTTPLHTVIDPRTLTTTYTHNGFGEVTQLVSPDTGTSSGSYDSGGNLKTATDARSATATYSYDVLNRVNQVAHTDQTINFTYDAGTNGIGRLTGASDANHTLSWAYDTLGRVTGKSQKIGTLTKSVGYAYTNGDLTSLVTPAGQTVVYGYTNHRITSITVNGTTILTGVTYFPFGSVSGWTWGNASTVSRTYNTDGNVSQIATAGDVLRFGYDNALRINSLSDTLFSTNGYTAGYDALDRLNSLAQTGVTSNWTYDADGNHLTQTGTSTVTTTPSTTSNRLNSISGSLVRTYAYDAAGDTLSYTGASFGFNQRGRMSSATVGSTSASYIYNALGQLIEKTVGGVTTLLMYDEVGHLLGEYSSTGALIQETVWMDDTPVATLRPNGSTITIYYVHTDHLNAPRVVTQSSSDNSIRWLWGGNAANQNPLGLGTFIYNLRYPGQYYQAETGLYYNYYRNYDPATGRYLESDPIGLAGGINPYAYTGSNPMSGIDPLGLATLVITSGPYIGNPAGHTALAFTGQGVYSYATSNPYGSDTTSYIQNALASRAVTITTLNTTPEQEQAMANLYNQYYPKRGGRKYSVLSHDCATAALDALSDSKAIDQSILDLLFNPEAPMLPFLPFTVEAAAALQPGATTITLPKGSSIPASLNSFNPTPH